MKQILSNRFVLVLLLAGMLSNTNAQMHKAANKLIPLELADRRGGPVSRIITGIDASVNIAVTSGIKYQNACQDNDAGKYKGEFIWYDANNETGKFLLQMVSQLNAVEQDKASFFAQSGFDMKKAKTEDFAGGTLCIIEESKPCVNEISGPTGKTEYISHARYFGFTGSTMIKIDFYSKVKSETVKSTIAKIMEEARKFDFSIFKTAMIQESE